MVPTALEVKNEAAQMVKSKKDEEEVLTRGRCE